MRLAVGLNAETVGCFAASQIFNCAISTFGDAEDPRNCDVMAGIDMHLLSFPLVRHT